MKCIKGSYPLESYYLGKRKNSRSYFFINIWEGCIVYIPSQKWDSENISYTSWWDKNLKKSTIQKVLRTLSLHIKNSQKLEKLYFSLICY